MGKRSFNPLSIGAMFLTFGLGAYLYDLPQVFQSPINRGDVSD